LQLICCSTLPPPPASRINAPPPAPISTPSLHDALPISPFSACHACGTIRMEKVFSTGNARDWRALFTTTKSTDRSRDAGRENLLDRKSTRLNSSHVKISYAVFCLKKKRVILEREAGDGG